MTTNGIAPGHIIGVNIKGRFFHAKVNSREAGAFNFTPLESGITYRSCTARQIKGHWRPSKGTPADVVATFPRR